MQKITKRKDGRYQAMVSLGRTPEGKLRRRTVYGRTKTEVRQKVRELESQVARGTVSATTRTDLTVADWAGQWLTEFVALRRPGTQRTYGALMRTHVLPALGPIRLDRLTPVDCQRLVNHSGLSPNTARQLATVTKSMLGKAVELGYISKNPMDGVELPARTRPDIHPLDEEGVAAFLSAAAASPYLGLYKTLLLTGLRISEALALTWGDVGGGVLTVSKQFANLKADTGFYPTKNGRTRQVPLTKALEATFDEIRAAQGPNPMGLVFTDPAGGRLVIRTVQDDFKRRVVEAGFPQARLHDLRHTYAVLSLKAGVDPKSLSEALGHASAAFTLDKYAYVTERMRAESAEKLDRLLGEMGLGADSAPDSNRAADEEPSCEKGGAGVERNTPGDVK